MKQYKYLIVAMIVFIAVSFAQGVFAADVISPHLSISPAVAQIDTDQGEQEKQIIHIRNQSDVPLPMKVKVTDFTSEDESGATILGDASDDPLNAPRLWFTIEDNSFILDPGETKAVEVDITVPGEIPLGGYYASILFEPQLPAHYFEEEQVRTIPVIGTLFLIAVGIDRADRTQPPLSVEEFSIPQDAQLRKTEKDVELSVVADARFPFTLRVKNSDIFHLKPSGTLTILTMHDKVESEIEILGSTILPQKIRIFPLEYEVMVVPWAQKILPGFAERYFAKFFFIGKHQAQLSLEAEDHVLEETIVFWFFPWKIILLTMITVILLLFLGHRYHIGQRVFRAFAVLFARSPQRSTKTTCDPMKVVSMNTRSRTYAEQKLSERKYVEPPVASEESETVPEVRQTDRKNREDQQKKTLKF